MLSYRRYSSNQFSVSSHSLNRETAGRGGKRIIVRTYRLVKNKTNKNNKYTCPQGETAPPGFNLWLQTQYRQLWQNMAPGSEPHSPERSQKSWGLPQLNPKATTGTPGFIPRHHSNSENESLVGTKQENMLAQPQTIQKASQKFLRKGTEHPGSEPDAEGPRERTGGRRARGAGREVGIRRRQRPRRKPSPRPSASSPAPGRALSPQGPPGLAGALYPSRRRLRHGRSRSTTPSGGIVLELCATSPDARTLLEAATAAVLIQGALWEHTPSPARKKSGSGSSYRAVFLLRHCPPGRGTAAWKFGH